MKKKYCFLILLCSCFLVVHGQRSAVSPYSRYGLGDLQFGGFCSEVSMAGVSAGIRNPYHINYSNPASYSGIRFATFEIGVKNQVSEFTTLKSKGSSSSASLSYLALGFPIVKGKWGASFGLIPYSESGYSIDKSDLVDQVGRVDYHWEGKGGLNRFYIGTAVTPFKNLSIGVNASYLFGSIQHIRQIEFPSQPFFYNTEDNQSSYLQDFYFNFGLQYVLRLKTDQQFIFGLAGSFASSVKSTDNRFIINYVKNGNYNSYVDTALSQTDIGKGSNSLPGSITGGVSYLKGEKWVTGIDYSFQNWSKTKSFGTNDSLNNSYRISIGAQLTPDFNSKSIFNRIHYRAGLRYAQTYLNLKGTPINEYGISLGFGIPLKIKGPPRVLPTISFAVEGGQRGTTTNNLLKEQYLRFNFGITISEEWFIPRKFD